MSPPGTMTSSGRVTNKVDAATNIVFAYKYDANNRLTNRWTPAKTNTFYAYDPAGNLTDIAYAVSSAIRLKYDALNRVTNKQTKFLAHAEVRTIVAAAP